MDADRLDEARALARIVPWGPDDHGLLVRIMGDPAMTVHLGGPETPEKIAERHEKYVSIPGSDTGAMFKIVDAATGEDAGSVGFWEKDWRGSVVWETGWSVVPECQGRGLAGAGTALVIAEAAAAEKHPFIHAFPSTENLASNALCRKLGFTLLEEIRFEYPPGHFMTCNDWRMQLY